MINRGRPSAAVVRPVDTEAGARWYGNPALIAVAFGTFVIVASPGLVAIALPSMSNSIGLSVRQAGWVQVCFQVGILAVLFSAAQVTERVGPRTAYTVGCVIFAIGSFGGAFGRTVAVLVGIRAIQGVGAALTIANNRAILARDIHASARGRAMGVMQAASGFGSALAIAAGGTLVAAFGWQGAFWLMGGLGIAAALVARSHLTAGAATAEPLPDRRSTVLSVVSFGTLAVALAGLALGDWHGALEAITLVCGLGALAAFALAERGARRPLAPWRTFAAPAVLGGNLGAVCIQASRAGVLFLVPFQLERELHYSPRGAALLLIALPIAETLLAPMSGWLFDRTGPRFPTCTGAAVAALGMILVAGVGGHTSGWRVAAALAISGLGLGLFHSANNGAVMSGVRRDLSYVASSVLATSITLGLALGSAAGSGIVAVRRAHYVATGSSATRAFDLALRDGLWVMAALAVVGAAASALRRPAATELPTDVPFDRTTQ